MTDATIEPDARFYTISDASFFVGTVALLNSLRLSGNHQDLIVLDQGFSEEQRALLSPHCRVVQIDVGDVGSPAWLKPYPHVLQDVDGIVIVVDSDAIVTGSLSTVLEYAESGEICAFSASSPDRWFGEWEEIFDLDSAPRRQPYVASGFVAFSTDRWPNLLSEWWGLCEPRWRLPYVRGRRRDPLQYLDQDALNAILMTEIPGDIVRVLPREANPFGFLLRQVQVLDARALRFACRGRETLILHNSGGRKPWERGTWAALRRWRPAYIRALRRVLTGDHLMIRLSDDRLPVWLRAGLPGAGVAASINAAASTRYRATDVRRALRGRHSASPPGDPVLERLEQHR